MARAGAVEAEHARGGSVVARTSDVPRRGSVIRGIVVVGGVVRRGELGPHDKVVREVENVVTYADVGVFMHLDARIAAVALLIHAAASFPPEASDRRAWRQPRASRRNYSARSPA